MGKNDALRIDGYGWGDVEEEVAPSPAPAVAAETVAPNNEQAFFEDRTPKPQEFGRPKKAAQEEVSNGWNIEEPASIEQSIKDKSVSPVRGPRAASKESPKKVDKPKPSAPKDKPFDLGIELPSSTSQIAMSNRRPEPLRDDRQVRDRRDSSSRSDDKCWGRDESRGRSQGSSESGRGDVRDRSATASENFDEQLGRTVRLRDVPSGTGAGYVKTGAERAPFTRAQPREDPASRTYHRKESIPHRADDLALGWGSESGSEDDMQHHGPVIKDFPVDAESFPMKKLTEKVASSTIEPSPAKTTSPPKATDFDARLMDARFGGDPKNAPSTSGISTPQWQPQPPASYPQKTTPARVGERQNIRDEDLGWGAVEESRKEEKKSMPQSQRAQSPPKRQQERADELGWGSAAQAPKAEAHKPTETYHAVPSSNRQAPQWHEGRSNSSGSIRIEDPNGAPVNIQELAGRTDVINGRDTEPQQTHPQMASMSSFMVGYGRGPNGTLDPVSAGQQLWVTCPYCHCGFGYPPLPVSGVPPAFINPSNQFASSSSPSNVYRQ